LIAMAICAPAQTSVQGKPAPARRTTRHVTPALPPVPLPNEPGLYAVIYTSMGNIVCRLFEKDAPKTVANFRGLATGAKPWTDPVSGKAMHAPLYSGTIFHRVIPDFMIQGGDPAGNGTGDPGYKFEDEITADHVFDHAGILAMANSGPNTNGSQFFITVAPTPWLNGKHTIFGEVVSGQDVVDAISKVPRQPSSDGIADAGSKVPMKAPDTPLTPVRIIRIAVRRVPVAKAAQPASVRRPGGAE